MNASMLVPDQVSIERPNEFSTKPSGGPSCPYLGLTIRRAKWIEGLFKSRQSGEPARTSNTFVALYEDKGRVTDAGT